MTHSGEAADAADAPDIEPTVVEDPIAGLAGGAFAVRQGGRAWIVVDPALPPPVRRAAEVHERVHLDRGPLPPARHLPPSWGAVVAREERVVDDEVARRLVPPAELRHAVERWLAADEPVTADVVALAFDTTTSVAATALDHLTATRRCAAEAGGDQSVGSPARNDAMASHHASGASNCGLWPASGSSA